MFICEEEIARKRMHKIVARKRKPKWPFEKNKVELSSQDGGGGAARVRN